ncbi:MAG: hypothetical protein H0X17_14260, partial [Deltaproteobacteria bacterium]|nr:hypothetical protein [Deltaproteobacteria bacterium]
MVRPLILACVLAIASWFGAAAAHAANLPGVGGLYASTGPALPMVDSKLEVVVRGPIVEVVVTQRFHNRADHATEATYIFPLPADAAVSAMWITTGTKTIHAAIAKR